ncbi:MAG: bifunctional precorrin-2 dehydrogenase/sirohydrochlorin ferrochelatase [Deltaproteobacteria bacterium]|nr:bifunctional precorrin-2 dehydrogenase/sirohydrochlorin ferrochelatase [Candidatus Zymogenaceae bacterium]
MGLFGIFLELAGRACLVVGGGAVGTRKVTSLLDAGGHVTVVSRELTSELRKLIDEGEAAYISGSFEPEHLTGVSLCVSAMDERDENEKVAGSCREHGVLVNVVDDPSLSDFFFPSVVRRGDLVIALSSGGVAPSMIKRIRQDLEAQYGREYEPALKILGRLRERLREAGVTGDSLADVMGRAADLPLAAMISDKRGDEIILRIREALVDGGVAGTVEINDLLDTEKR